MQASADRKLSISWSLQSKPEARLNANFRLVPFTPNSVGKAAEELYEAKSFQQSLLPGPIADTLLTVEPVYYPFSTLSGDFIDYWQNSDGSIQGYLFDVTGHNIVSALAASSLRTLFRQASELTPKLYAQLSWINNELWQEKREPLPATALIFHLNPKDGILQYAAAGMGPFYYDDGSTIHKVETMGFPLGAVKEAHYYSCFLKVKMRNTLLFMTDGFSEAITPGTLPAESFVTLLRQLKQSGLNDDASAIIIKLL